MPTLILSETSSDRITNYQSMNGIEGKCNNFFLFLNGWADYFDLYRKLNVKIWRMIWHIPIFGEFFRLTTMRESGPCYRYLTFTAEFDIRDFSIFAMVFGDELIANIEVYLYNVWFQSWSNLSRKWPHTSPIRVFVLTFFWPSHLGP